MATTYVASPVNGRKIVSLEANGRGNWIPLSPGLNRILLKSTSWSGSSVALKFNTENTDGDYALKDSAGSAITATANYYTDFFGPGYVCGVMSSYGSTPVTIEVVDADSPIAR